jgi:hypothetical protein
VQQARLAVIAFACAIAVDVVTKVYAVGHAVGPHDVVYNARPSNLAIRLWMSVLTLSVVWLLEHFGRRRGIGRLWGAWVAVGVLVGGTLSNGVSTYLWTRGVPDFIHVSGGWVWNLADFEIVFGLLGTALSAVVAALVAFARSNVARREPA